MPDSGIDITPARRPGSSRVKNVQPPADDTPRSIKEVNGFAIIEKVGQGGMGAVYKARQKSLDRVVALKVLPPRIAKSAKFIERFQREARASAKLCHPNLVQGIDVGQDPVSKLWYFAMEFIDGPSLKKLIKDVKYIPERRALEIVREVARALDCIHSEGMVHRDIKPDNIILTSRGDVKVADFGLTRAVEDDSEMTQSGSAIGTPHYMPPEQVRGQHDLDIRADLYALGATLYYIVTGQTPFSGASSAEVMSKHLTEPVPSAHKVRADVSEACSRLIIKLMDKKREDRVQTPQDLVARINALLDPNNAATGKRTTIMNAARSSGMRQAVRAGTSGQRNAVGKTTGQRTAIAMGGIESTGPLQRVTTGQRAAVASATTGSAEPVSGEVRDASASAARKAVAAKKSPVLMWIIVGVAIAGVFASFALLTGKSEKPQTAQKAPESQPAPAAIAPAPTPAPAPAAVKAPSRDEKARAALNTALEADKAHPENFAAIFEALKSAAEFGRDTSVAPAVEEARKNTEQRWTDSFGAALKTANSAANAAAAQGDFATAMAALEDKAIPDNLRVLNWREQLENARKAVHDSAETAVKKTLDDAQTLAKAGDEAGITAAIERLKFSENVPADLAPSAPKIAETRTRYTADLAALREKAEAAKKERLEKAQIATANVRKQLTPVLAQCHFSATLELLDKKLQDPALAAAKEALAADKADIEAIIALRQSAVAAIRASGAKAITLSRGKTTLSGKVLDEPNGKNITLKLPDGPEMSIGIDQLEARDINAFAPAAQDKAEDARRRGLLFLAIDDFSKAKEYFKTAHDSGLGDAVKPYLDRIEIAELGETEVRARREWTEANTVFQAKRWEEALRAYTHFKDTYGNTKYMAEVAIDLKSRLELIDTALHPCKPGLAATYYRGREFNDQDKLLARVDEKVDFEWTVQPPAKEIPHDQYCVRWVGQVKAPKAGHYTFATLADDGTRLWIDGKQLINDWTDHGTNRVAGEIDLPEGPHQIRLEFYQAGGGANCKLLWALKDGFGETVIPPDALSHEPQK